MKPQIQTLLSSIKQLSHSERVELRSALDSLEEYKKVCDTIEQLQDKNPHCPHCGSIHAHKHGTVSGLQRYKCTRCNKTFNALTNTPIAHLRKKGKWLSYLGCMLNSDTIRKSAEQISVNKKTAFLWRHRFTEWMNINQPQELNGIVEVDETYYRESFKGSRKLPRKAHKRGGDAAKRGLSFQQICVVIACDRSKKEVEGVSGKGAVKEVWLNENMNSRIAKDSVLVTDGHYAYNRFADKAHIEHITLKNRQGERVKGCYHIQHVNSYHGRLREWIIAGFHGVATRYLDHYLWWRHQLERSEKVSPIDLLSLAIGIPQLNGT